MMPRSKGFTLQPENDLLFKRILAARLFTLALFGLLLGRLWYLQILQGAAYEQAAWRTHIREVRLPAPRGVIYDTHGDILAGSRPAYHVAIMPSAMADPELELRRLAQLVDFTPEEWAAAREVVRTQSIPAFQLVTVKGDIDIRTITRVEEELITLPGVLIANAPLRDYPQGSLAAHVVGYVGEISPAMLEQRRTEEYRQQTLAGKSEASRQFLQVRLNYRAGDLVGKCGIEAVYDEYLRGQEGGQRWEVDARGKPVRALDARPATPGGNVQLTLDLKLQRVAEKALEGKVGAVVVLDPRNGAVRVLASSPTFNPNEFIPRIDRQTYRTLLQNPYRPFLNRATQGTYPPGSTFKMVTTTAGLKAQVISRGTTSHCAGGIRRGMWFGCWSHHGTVALLQAIAQSCDVFFYRVGERLGPERLAQCARDFGLGSPTGLDLPSEAAGVIPSEAWLQATHQRRWYLGDTLNISIGQGDILATPLQMALVAATVANGGTVYRPQLVKRIEDSEHRPLQVFTPQEIRRLDLAPHILKTVREGMSEAVRTGTGRGVRIPGVEIAGKTGSAEIGGRKPHAWFVSFAPYPHPRYATAVIVEHGGHGSESAAPITRQIYEAAFGINQEPAPAPATAIRGD